MRVSLHTIHESILLSAWRMVTYHKVAYIHKLSLARKWWVINMLICKHISCHGIF